MNFKRTRQALSVVLCLMMVFSCAVPGFAAAAADTAEDEAMSYMQEVVNILGADVDGEDMFDFLSYVYLGWRTTGGSWQNQVIDSFVSRELAKAGYTLSTEGSNSCTSDTKSENDKSSATDDDYAWVTYFNDVSSNVWSPEYAKLELSLDADFEGKDALINAVNVESYSFNPTCDTYQNFYGKDIDEMWAWITEKDENGNRVNVLNGEEALLNKRVHLATNSCFTEPAGTNPAEAVGNTGEIVWVGKISKSGSSYKSSEIADENLSSLAGKVLFTDSSLSNAFNLAKQVGAVAVMSKASLSNYSVPYDADGNIVEPFGDSARYASGANINTTLAQTNSGAPIVEWQLSNNQYNAIKSLLAAAADAGKPLMATSITIGDVYAMNDASKGGKGQAINIAEIKGASKPDERVFLCAHVQEPSSNDNATGVATLLGIATEMKKLIDEGKLERPERTITFMWGDEMTMARLYISSHKEEAAKIVSVLDLDMTGEDPEKTGGVMRIEKTPDPSAEYNYTLDPLPWEADAMYDETYKDSDDAFVRLPDSHTLWGAGSTKGIFKTGFYLNDLYMYATKTVIANHDSEFKVDVCPYEGGSDHSVFLQNQIPAMLTWHFTDYTYHTSVDTLAMSSAREMENVGITSLAAAIEIANACDKNEEVAMEMLTEVYNAAMERFDTEETNTDHHKIYAVENSKDMAAEYANECEVLNAWGEWYQQALMSVEETLLTNPSEEYVALRESLSQQLAQRNESALDYAKCVMMDEHTAGDWVAVVPPCVKEGSWDACFCVYCGKYMSMRNTEVTPGDHSKCLFTDIAASGFHDEIIFANSLGLVSGYTDGSYRPNVNVTRAQFVTLVWRMAGEPEAKDSTLSFTDADSIAAPYRAAVAWGVEAGVIAGYGDNSFRPNQDISRAQMATFIYRYLMKVVEWEAPAEATASAGYVDEASISENYLDAVNAMAYLGIMKGVDTAPTFNPDGVATRGMAAAVVLRAATADV